jgi:hypothetical protein
MNHKQVIHGWDLVLATLEVSTVKHLTDLGLGLQLAWKGGPVWLHSISGKNLKSDSGCNSVLGSPQVLLLF